MKADVGIQLFGYAIRITPFGTFYYNLDVLNGGIPQMGWYDDD